MLGWKSGRVYVQSILLNWLMFAIRVIELCGGVFTVSLMHDIDFERGSFML